MGSLSNTGKARLASTLQWFIFGTFIKVPGCWRFSSPLSNVSLSVGPFWKKTYKRFETNQWTGGRVVFFVRIKISVHHPERSFTLHREKKKPRIDHQNFSFLSCIFLCVNGEVLEHTEEEQLRERCERLCLWGPSLCEMGDKHKQNTRRGGPSPNKAAHGPTRNQHEKLYFRPRKLCDF